MSCDEVEARLADAITAGETLSPEVEGHLATCARCRTRAEELRATVELVRGLAGPDEAVAPPSFESVLERARAPGRRARRGLVRAVGLGLALVVGVAADRLALRATPPAPSEPPALVEPSARPAPARPTPVRPETESDALRRELAAAAPGGVGGSLAVLGGLARRR